MKLRMFLIAAVAGLGVARAAESSGGMFFGRAPDPQKIRRYFIAAEPVLWDYAPSGKDEICGNPLPPALQRDDRRVGKLRYVQYTDATFTTKVMDTPALGILGPVLRGVVGDFLVVTFLNRTGQPLSMHPHGVKYDKDSEGSFYQPLPGKGVSVPPDGSFTYVWQLDAASGPLPDEPSSKAWLYHSHVAGDDEINAGLVGFIIVTDPKRARPDGTPADVDRELATLLLIFDESGLAAEAKEAYEYVNNGSGIPTKTWAETQQLLEAGERPSINGRLFGNLPGLEANEGERVRWYLFGLGSEQDFHTAHWHGQRVLEDGRRRTDVVELMPGSMKTADLLADNPGEWLFHCHVADHMREGMYARLTVHGSDRVGASRAPERAFLGLNGAQPSLRIARAEVARPGRGSFALALAGEATVFDAFSVFNQSIRIQLGEKSLAFAPDRSGRAASPEGTLQITNAGGSGVIYGGLMKFELALNGDGWRGALEKLGAVASNGIPAAKKIPLAMEIGKARHVAEVELR